jgi:hypothetical protein
MTYYYHGKTSEGRSFTIAGKFDHKENIELGIGLCSAKDTLNRKLGRKIAEGRLESAHDKGRAVLGTLSIATDETEGFIFRHNMDQQLEGQPADRIRSLFKL